MAVALGVLAFAACGDDDPTTPPPGDDLKPMAAYSVQATADLLEVADVVVTYYDANGNAQTETITTTDVWQKKVSVTAGKNVGCSVRVTPVAQNAGGDNAPIAKSGATYDLGLSFGHVFYEVDENGDIKNLKGNGFSADGSVIAGVVNDANYMPCATIWRLQDDGTYAYDLFYQKYFSMDGSAAENTYSSIRPKGLSANGKYLSLTLMDALGQYVARYDVEQGTLDAFIPDGTNGMEAGTIMESSAIADDGKMACLIFSGTGMMQQQTAGVWENNGEAPYALAEKYPELTELADFANGGYPQLNDITPDGRYIAGYAYSNGIDYCSFIIDLGEGTNGIKAITNGDGNSAETARYTIDGKRITAPVKGLNIIKKADGSAVKVIVK